MIMTESPSFFRTHCAARAAATFLTLSSVTLAGACASQQGAQVQEATDVLVEVDRVLPKAESLDASAIEVTIKVGGHPLAGEHRMGVVRTGSGPDTELYVDANGGYQRAEAAAWAEIFAAAGARWLEEPLTSEDLEGLRVLRGKAPPGLAIAAGEYADGIAATRRLLEAEAVDVLQLDATRCGGITGFLSCEALARAHRTQVSAHCAPTAHLAVAAAVPSLRHIEWFHDHIRIERLLFHGAPAIEAGVVEVDRSKIGNGLALRDDVDR